MFLYALCYRSDTQQYRRGTRFYRGDDDASHVTTWTSKTEAQDSLEGMAHRTAKLLEVVEFGNDPNYSVGVADVDVKAGQSVTVAKGRAFLTHSPLVIETESAGRRLGSEGGAK